jgi:hypothetical protein
MNQSNDQMSFITRFLAISVLVAAGTLARAQVPAASITSISAQTRVVTARVNASGQQFQFTLNTSAQLSQLRVGQGVYVNLKTKQVSLDGRTIAGQIVNSQPAEQINSSKVAATKPASGNSSGSLKLGTRIPSNSAMSGQSNSSIPTPQGAISPFQIVGLVVEDPTTNGIAEVGSGGTIQRGLDWPCTGEGVGNCSLTADFGIRNLGTQTLSNVKVQVVISPIAGGQSQTITTTIPVWAPDTPPEYLNPQFAWKPMPGTYSLTATVDPDHQFSSTGAHDWATIQITYLEIVPVFVDPTKMGVPISDILTATIRNNAAGACSGGLTPYSPPPGVGGAPGVEAKLIPPDPLSAGFAGCSIDGVLYHGVELNLNSKPSWKLVKVQSAPPFGSLASQGTISALDNGTNPTLEMHFHGEVPANQQYPMDAIIKVTIAGPAGTNPFTVTGPTSLSLPALITKPAASGPVLKAIGVSRRKQ